MIIAFETQDNGENCVTPCKISEIKDLMIGSAACQECGLFDGFVDYKGNDIKRFTNDLICNANINPRTGEADEKDGFKTEAASA